MEKNQEEAESKVIVLDGVEDIAEQSKEKTGLDIEVGWADENNIGSTFNLFGIGQVTVGLKEKMNLFIRIRRYKEGSPAENFFVGGKKC